MKKDLRFYPSRQPPSSLTQETLKFVPTQARGLWVRNDYKFVPSVFGILDRLSTTERRERREYSLDWWTDTALYYYDSLLVSAYYGMEKWDFREFYKIPRKNFLFVSDSGGWQVVTQSVKIEPIDLLKWMEHNADFGLTLDVPPVDPISKKTYLDDQFEGFKKTAELSRRNYEIMHRHWKENDFQLLKVIHGVGPRQLDYWYRQVEDLEFSGLAFSPHPPSEQNIAILLAYGRDKGAKKVHIFTGTGIETTPIVIYGRKYFDQLTYDSSAFSTQGAALRAYFVPYDLGQKILFGKSYNSTLKQLPCNCPVCQLATVDDLNSPGSVPGGLIALHNLWVYLMYCVFLDSITESKDIFIEYLRRNNLTETIKAVRFLDLSEEVGFYDAYNRIYKAGGQDVSNLFP